MLRSAPRPSVSATTVSALIKEACLIYLANVSIPCQSGKQPGHESSSCPRPRTTESFGKRKDVDSSIIAKQCYNCQGLGHVQADCPTLRLNGGANGRCYNCNQPGHLARNCPAPASGAGRGVGAPRGGFNGGFRGGYGGYPRAATCYKCGGPNHFARDCQAHAMKCYACGKLGHISRDCTAPNGGPLSSAGKVCYKCSQAGHISRDCPNNDAANQQPAESATAPAAAAAAPAATTVTAEVSAEAAPVPAPAPTAAVA
ncbi:putative zinc knuckle nucleic acid binding protein [Aspergillus fumigatus]